MALTGNTVQSTYLDLVQLEKSGAGLPAHAGKEAAVYDGSGAQILGRTAVRHWLDPHPDAATANAGSPFAETWEFSTTGDMTQAALETAGWTFDNCTAEVSGGQLLITLPSAAGGSVYCKASLDVSFSGDFDVVATPGVVPEYTTATHANSSGIFLGLGVADYRAGVADAAHYDLLGKYNGSTLTDWFYTNGTWTGHGGSADQDNIFGGSALVRIFRDSGNVYGCAAGFCDIGGAIVDSSLSTTYSSTGWSKKTAVADSSTFNKLFLIFDANNAIAYDAVYAVTSIRRFQ